MMLRKVLAISMLFFLIFLLNACTKVEEEESASILKTTKIMADRNAQFAITLNENLEWDLLGTRAGKLIKDFEPVFDDCDDTKQKNCAGKANLDESVPDAASKDSDLGELFFQQTFTVTIHKGSCCVRVSSNTRTKKYCAPPYPIEFINGIAAQRCSGEGVDHHDGLK